MVIATFFTACSDKSQQAYEAGQQAQALFDSGDLPAARIAIGRAMAISDDQLDLMLLDGRIKFAMRDFEAAFDSYNLALAIDPSNQEALQAVSQIGVSIGSERESLEATDRLLRFDPQQSQALLVKGIHALNKRKFAEAQAIGEQILRTDPSSEGGIVLKARGMFLGGKRAEAFAILRKASEAKSGSQMISTALLECARDQAEPDNMINQFRILSNLVPKNADLTIDEANIRYKSGYPDEARSRGFALLKDNGNNFDAVQRLRDLWLEYDQTPLNPEQLAVISQEGQPAARIMVARFYLENGDVTNAGELVGGLQGDIVDGLRLRIAYLAGGKTAAAQAERLLKSDKTNCDALSVRYDVAMRNKNASDAVIAAQVITTECPDREDGFIMLAQAYSLAGKPSGANRAYADGVQALPLNTKIVLHYTNWLIANNRQSNAVSVAKRLTQRAPAKVSGWKLLKSVCANTGDSVCMSDANAGEAQARKTLQIDLPPGERRPNPLLGNFWR